jgi:peptidoglycan/xylan/chitin deacetylase (PgdA/CDA1 family)
MSDAGQGVRTIVKSAVERLLGNAVVARAGLRRYTGRVLILAYHNIVPEGDEPAGERSLHTDQAAFAAQLDELRAFMPILPLRSVLSGELPGDSPCAVITFDDAYRGAVTAGVDELNARGIPATIFVAPAFVGGRTFWWDAFASPCTGELDAGFRTQALEQCRGDDTLIRELGARLGIAVTPLPDHAAAAGEVDLHKAHETGLIDFASHTWSHRNLQSLTREEQRQELDGARLWLDRHFPGGPPALAAPYGLGAQAVAEVAGEAGLRAVLRIDGGWSDSTSQRILPRWNVPRGISRRGLRLRLAGILS